jgi:hypothetical protein
VADDPEIYPNSEFPLHLQLPLYLTLDFCLLVFLACCKMLKSFHHQLQRPMLLRLAVVFACLVVLACNGLLLARWDLDCCADMLVRPVFLTVYNKRVRRTVMIYLKILLRSWRVLFLMGVNLLTFAGVGFVLLSDISSADYPFLDYWDAVYNLVVLQTTSNFPDVMLPYYI